MPHTNAHENEALKYTRHQTNYIFILFLRVQLNHHRVVPRVAHVQYVLVFAAPSRDNLQHVQPVRFPGTSRSFADRLQKLSGIL